MEDQLLSFVSNAEGNTVSIHLDKDGIDYLQNILNRLRSNIENNKCEHDHLFTEEWNGYSDGLSGTKLINQEEEKNIVHHVKIYGWTNERRMKHNL